MAAEATIQLDPEHSIRIEYDDEGEPYRATTFHPNQDGETCFGSVDIGEGEWTIRKETPLSITPSIVCAYCDSHAVINNGNWYEYWKAEPPQHIREYLARQSRLDKIKDWLKNFWGNA